MAVLMATTGLSRSFNSRTVDPLSVMGQGAIPPTPPKQRPASASPRFAGSSSAATVEAIVYDRNGHWTPSLAFDMSGLSPRDAPRSRSHAKSARPSVRPVPPASLVHRVAPQKPPTGSPAVSPAAAKASVASVASSASWAEQVRPAITWLFGFVDSQLVMAEGLRPEACKKFLEEHHRAFGDVCTKVNGVLNASGDGLALCIWRALVALLTHFTGKVGPMTRRLRAVDRKPKAKPWDGP